MFTFYQDDRKWAEVGNRPESTNHWTNAGLLLAQRLRRWPNIKQSPVKCLMFSGVPTWAWVGLGQELVSIHQQEFPLFTQVFPSSGECCQN